MKTQILLFGLILIMAKPAVANKVDSKISDVTVYLNGAQVYRKAKSYVKKGTNEIVINDVSPYLNKKSIQASCSGSALILDVKHNIEYNDPVTISEPLPERIVKAISALEDSLFYQNLRIDKIKNQLNNLATEKNIIANNKTIRGDHQSDSLALFMVAVDFYHERLEIIESQITKLKIRDHKLRQKKNNTQTKLNDLRNYSQHKTVKPKVKPQVHQIVLTVHADYAAEINFDVNYLVDRAGWVPSYDLRAKSVNDAVSLTYKASIFQKTGEDWSNVNLTLSTFNQECSFTMPTLAVWEIMEKSRFQQKQKSLTINQSNGLIDNHNAAQKFYGNIHSNTVMPTSSETFANARALAGYDSNGGGDEFILPPSLISNTDKTLSNVEFKIKNRYSISADGKENMLVVRNTPLNSSFNYISVPKVNTDAFLLANITNWRALNILPARANIYFDNSFVGETEIRPENMSDTMSLAIGRERGIEITRKKIDDDAKEKLIGKNKTREITIELAIKNTNKSMADISIKDQIPVSKDDRIKIKQVALNGADLEDLTGLLSWKLKLKPGQTEIIKFTYQIVHDKEIEVI